MRYITPEQAGISAKHVLAFYKELDANHLSTHAVILSRGESFFSECYYAPFHKDFKHRMYSVSKSFVSVAVGFCEQDGLLDLDDPINKYFPEYGENALRHTGTIRQYLQMSTMIPPSANWFKSGTKDRVEQYFSNEPKKFPGTTFAYDSSGSFLMGALVERLTGKTLIEYLQEKVLSHTGFSPDARFLQCPGGHAWGDSGLLCTARDLWLFARFVLNGGTWEGKRYLNAEYLKKATDTCVPTNAYGYAAHGDFGYGYQFWGQPDGCYACHGMGNQIAFCDPGHDFIFVINSGNEGNPVAYDQIYSALYHHIVGNLGQPLPEDPAALAELEVYTASRKLFSLGDGWVSPFAQKISGRKFLCRESAAGIRWFRLDLMEGEGKFTYENQQGEKTISFGMGYNIFEKFPETDYSDQVGTYPEPGHQYDSAVSADWAAEKTLRVRVQIIDRYFGNLGILFAFADENHATVRMDKTAEAYMENYQGLIFAEAEEKNP